MSTEDLAPFEKICWSKYLPLRLPYILPGLFTGQLFETLAKISKALWRNFIFAMSHSFPGPFLLTWISNHIPSKEWDAITNPFPHFNGATLEVWVEWSISSHTLWWMLLLIHVGIILNPCKWKGPCCISTLNVLHDFLRFGHFQWRHLVNRDDLKSPTAREIS